MIFEPPVEKMVEEVGNNYKLAILMAKRAKQIAQQPSFAEQDNPDKKELQLAAEEIYAGKVVIDENK